MRNYLIIGASSGIGRALRTRLQDEGHNVIGTYNETQIEGSRGVTQQLDVRTGELDLESIPDELHGLIYCPGDIQLRPFHRIKPEQFVEDYDLQVIGAIKVIQAALDKLKKGRGSIVLFSTVAVDSGFNFHSLVSASKGAIQGLTRALAAEFAPTIRVNCIAPSLTNTPLANKLLNTEEKIEKNAARHPLNRVGEAKDIASVAAFLLSEENNWMTGQILRPDGGISSLKN